MKRTLALLLVLVTFICWAHYEYRAYAGPTEKNTFLIQVEEYIREIKNNDNNLGLFSEQISKTKHIGKPFINYQRG